MTRIYEVRTIQKGIGRQVEYLGPERQDALDCFCWFSDSDNAVSAQVGYYTEEDEFLELKSTSPILSTKKLGC